MLPAPPVYFLPQPCFSREPRFHVVQNDVRNQDVGSGGSQCPWGATAFRTFSRQSWKYAYMWMCPAGAPRHHRLLSGLLMSVPEPWHSCPLLLLMAVVCLCVDQGSPVLWAAFPCSCSLRTPVAPHLPVQLPSSQARVLAGQSSSPWACVILSLLSFFPSLHLTALIFPTHGIYSLTLFP